MRGGPRSFPQGFSCPVVLWILPWCSSSAYGALTLFGCPSQAHSASSHTHLCSPEPPHARMRVWAPPVSLAATPGIDVSFRKIFSFLSSGYLDVSVRRVPSLKLWIHFKVTEFSSAGFPHSDIHVSLPVCGSSWLFAAYRVLLRLPVPRHPPRAFLRLTSPASSAGSGLFPYLPFPLLPSLLFRFGSTAVPLFPSGSPLFSKGHLYFFLVLSHLHLSVLPRLSCLQILLVSDLLLFRFRYSVFKVQY